MRHTFIIIAVAFLLPLNATKAEETTEYTIVDNVCETYVEWTGTHIDKIDLSVLGDRPYRVLKPDSMATMDYIPDRLNIMTTQDGVILTQECG